MTDPQPTLPGLEPLTPHASSLERAAAAQLAYLEGQRLLGPQHALVVSLVREAAKVAGAAAQGGKGAAFALASKELREALALLPVAAGPEDPWDRLQRELAETSAATDQAQRSAAGYSPPPGSTGSV